MFQSTHPRGVRLKRLRARLDYYGFNPRTHVGCDDFNPPNNCSFISFNPRTHVGCDNRAFRGACEGGVSIHAPTWGATGGVRRQYRKDDVSIHAPTWGATKAGEYYIGHAGFNPRTHVGCDTSHFFYKCCEYVSIHAPTWGATYIHCSYYYILMCFNPRTHVGCDPLYRNGRAHGPVSIHAPTWGATNQQFKTLES